MQLAYWTWGASMADYYYHWYLRWNNSLQKCQPWRRTIFNLPLLPLRLIGKAARCSDHSWHITRHWGPILDRYLQNCIINTIYCHVSSYPTSRARGRDVFQKATAMTIMSGAERDQIQARTLAKLSFVFWIIACWRDLKIIRQNSISSCYIGVVNVLQGGKHVPTRLHKWC